MFKNIVYILLVLTFSVNAENKYYILLEEDKKSYAVLTEKHSEQLSIIIADLDDDRWFTETFKANETIDFHIALGKYIDYENFFHDPETFVSDSRYKFEQILKVQSVGFTSELSLPKLKKAYTTKQQVIIGGETSQTYYVGTYKFLYSEKDADEWFKANKETFCQFALTIIAQEINMVKDVNAWKNYIVNTAELCKSK